MNDHYILDGHTPVKADLMTWARWFQTAKDERVVAKTNLGHVRVSTVFFGLDHNWEEDGPPHIFETMIFGGPQDQWQERCSTWAEAEELHNRAVAIAVAAFTDTSRGEAVTDLIGECRRFALAHRSNGESRTADLLERVVIELQKRVIPAPVNLPFERVPVHASDPGFGPVPPKPDHCPHGIRKEFVARCVPCNTADTEVKHGT